MKRSFTLPLYSALDVDLAFAKFAARFIEPEAAPELHWHHCLTCSKATNCGSAICQPPSRSRIAWCDHCKAKTQRVVSWNEDQREDSHRVRECPACGQNTNVVFNEGTENEHCPRCNNLGRLP